MNIEYLKLHNDIMVKLSKDNKPLSKLSKELGFTYTVISNISLEKDMLLKNYIKLVYWLEKPMDYYIINN